MTTWQICFYYSGTGKDIFDHVEQGLKDGGYEWKNSINSGGQRRDTRRGVCAEMCYVVTRDDVDGFYWLDVCYHGYRSHPDVDITITLDPRKKGYRCN